MNGLIILLPIISVMIGLYLITVSFWELREGTDRARFIKYMFTGLCLLFILPPLVWMVGGVLSAGF